MTAFMCNECQRQFGTKDELVDHLEDSHGAISAFVRRSSTKLEDGEPIV